MQSRFSWSERAAPSGCTVTAGRAPAGPACRPARRGPAARSCCRWRNRPGRPGRRRSAAGPGAPRPPRGRPGRARRAPPATAPPPRAAAGAAARARPARRRSARAGPPLARRRRTVSRSAAAAGSLRRGGGVDHLVDPALDQRERGLQPGQRGLLLRGVLRLEQPAGERLLQRLGVARVDAAHRLLEPGGVDRDAARVGLDGVDQVRAQPRHVREQPLVGGLAQRQVQPHLVGGHLEARAERGDVRRQQRRRAAGGERQADVGRADHLAAPARRSPGRSGCRTSRRRCCASSAAAGRPARPPAPATRRAATIGPPSPASIAAHRVDDLAGDRVDQLAPRRQRRLDPLGAAPGLDRGGPGRRTRRPRPATARPAASRRAPARARPSPTDRSPRRGHGLPGHVARQVPVHRAALVGQQLPEPGEGGADVAAPPPIRAANGSTGWSEPPGPDPESLLVVAAGRG